MLVRLIAGARSQQLGDVIFGLMKFTAATALESLDPQSAFVAEKHMQVILYVIPSFPLPLH